MSTTTYAHTTLLEAVNTLLMAIGESPVNRVDSPGVVEAVQAKAVILEVNRAVQSRGWHFNTRRGIDLLPQSFAPFFIYVPENTLSVDTVLEDRWIDVVLHGNKLYDSVNDTYEFTRPLKVDLVSLLPFENIPQQARHYVTIRAARIFQGRAIGSTELDSLSEADEIRAFRDLHAMETRRAGYNALRGGPLSKIRRHRKQS